MFSDTQKGDSGWENEQLLDSASSPERRIKGSIWGLPSVLSIGFFLSLCVNVYFVAISRIQQNREADNGWARGLETPTTRSQLRFNSSIMPTSEYTGKGPSVDAAWDRFTDSPIIDGTAVVMAVSEEELLRSGQGPERLKTIVRFDHTREPSYMGTLELFHQLHCLNVLRKFVHYEYYKDKDEYFASHDVAHHSDHCVEMLRQVLMCNSDSQLIPFHFVYGWPGPVPDFNTLHQCRDPEALLEWAKTREAPLRSPIYKPEHVIALSDRP